jgi:hypothetical protein
VYPDAFKEVLVSGFYGDALLADSQNCHLGKAINIHKTQSFPLLVDERTNM